MGQEHGDDAMWVCGSYGGVGCISDIGVGGGRVAPQHGAPTLHAARCAHGALSAVVTLKKRHLLYNISAHSHVCSICGTLAGSTVRDVCA